MSDIVLSKGIRNNLLQLQSTAENVALTQGRLSTGKKVNSALDNPSNFFTAAALNSRAGDLANLLDGLSNGIKVLEAADNGLKSITKSIESLQSTVRQARQDKTYKTASYDLASAATIGTAAVKNISFSGGAVGSTPVDIALNVADVAGPPAVPGKVKTVDEIVEAINSNTSLKDKIRASNDNGKLRIENQSTSDLTVTGVTSGGTVDGGTATKTIGPNDVRKSLVNQFNEIRNQLDKFASDASFNGINLLRGDRLKLYLNENSTSTIEIQAKDTAGTAREVNNAALGIGEATNVEFENDTSLDDRLSELKTAMDTIRSQASSFGSNLSIVQNRQDFTKSTINTLKTGADTLVLADMNEEAASLLSLQTRQQLSQTALSLANQADQGVLRLFG